MAMKDIAFLGDIHGSMSVMNKALQTAARYGIRTIVQVGDFWLYSPSELAKIRRCQKLVEQQFGVKVVVHFIDGNHEDYRVINPHGDTTVMVDDSLIYHPRGDVFEVEGVRIGCFGGAESIDKDRRVEGKTWFADEVPSEDDFQKALARFTPGSLDVLVTHDIPDFALEQVCDSNKVKYSIDSGRVRAMVGELVRSSKVPVVLHGHWHCLAQGKYDDVSVFSLTRDGHYGSMMSVHSPSEVEVLYHE